MAVIKIKDLGAPGSMLFSDSETYLNELTEDELGASGGFFTITATVTLTVTYTISLTRSKSWTW
jgi:hypothetical protein